MNAETLLAVLPRFRGPPGSANGGYFAGLVAALAAGPVTVRLRHPPPLGVALRATRVAAATVTVHHGEQLVAESRPATLDATAPDAVPYMAALAASRGFSGFTQHAFPECFVCGPARTRGDGLRIFAGPVAGREPTASRRVAAPWVPDPTLAAADGKVAAEFIWAALDCPGYFAVAEPGETMLLAELNARIERRVHVDEPCVLLGWALQRDGRRALAGTALYGRDGGLCAQAQALWIAPRSAGG